MKIKIEDGLKVIDQDIVRLLNYDYPSTQFVELPNSLKEIKERSFAGCISLQTITIPNGVTRIGKDAFACCRQLRSVTFPISLQLIDEYAFVGKGVMIGMMHYTCHCQNSKIIIDVIHQMSI